MTPPTDHRTLSARVAVEVMGWTEVELKIKYWQRTNGTMIPVYNWNPTTSWSDTGLVVEEMRRKGWEPCMNVANDGQWHCGFEHKDCPDTEWDLIWVNLTRQEARPKPQPLSQHAYAPTLPLAVSLAALAAVAAGKETTGEVQST